jgi:hypothetical protein
MLASASDEAKSRMRARKSRASDFGASTEKAWTVR